MSSGVKKRQVRLARKVVSGKMTMAQARATYSQEMARNRAPTRKQLVDQALRQVPAVVKSAGPEAVKVNAQHQALYDAGPAAMRAWHARQVLEAADGESCDPQFRENIRPGRRTA